MTQIAKKRHYRNVFQSVSREKKIQLIFVFIFMLFSGLIESFALTSFFPFLQFLSQGGSSQIDNTNLFPSLGLSSFVYTFVVFAVALLISSVIKFGMYCLR